MTKKQHYMRYDERIRLEEKLRYKVPIAQIARELGFSRRAVYDEIKRGTYPHTEDYRDVDRYSADKGQIVQNQNCRNKGRGLKIGKDRALSAFLEEKILREKCSPAVALELARREGFQTSICVQTMWTRIGNPLEEFPEWVQPIGAHDAYSKGAKTSHNGKRWGSEVDGNTWEPGVYGWAEYSEPEPQEAPQEAQDGASEEPGE